MNAQPSSTSALFSCAVGISCLFEEHEIAKKGLIPPPQTFNFVTLWEKTCGSLSSLCVFGIVWVYVYFKVPSADVLSKISCAEHMLVPLRNPRDIKQRLAKIAPHLFQGYQQQDVQDGLPAILLYNII